MGCGCGMSGVKRRAAKRTAKRRSHGLEAVRTYDNGSLYSVAFGAEEIRDFRRSYPASGLDSLRSVWAQFDRKNGDLVDLKCNGASSCHRFDGAGLVALTEDMQCHATLRGKKARAPKDHCRKGR